MKTACKFRMYPNKQQEASLDLTLDTCRYLYNQALADRKNAYEQESISRTNEAQAARLVAEKKDGNFKGVFSQVLQDVLRRLDKSFTYPQVGFKLDGSKRTLSKIGSIRIFKHCANHQSKLNR
jgi:putative transposase